LDETTNYIRPLGKIRDIEIATDYAKDTLIVSDRQKLMQVILNLLSNALKYGPENSVVQLRAMSHPEKIVIEVEDSGSGIHLSRRAGLFTPFDRLGAERTKTEGTGLGLALSKQIMDAMGGTITVAEDKSLFSVTLPIKTKNSPDSNELKINPKEQLQENPSTPVPVSNTLKAKQLKILYVEDNASNRALIEAMIKRYPSMQLHMANNLKDGLHFLKNILPDLVMLDLHLPDGSGETLIEFMKKNPPFQNTPILVLSADAMPETIERLKKMQVTEYYTKPLDIARFNQQLQHLLLINK